MPITMFLANLYGKLNVSEEVEKHVYTTIQIDEFRQ